MNDRIHPASPPGTSGLPSSGQTLVLFAHGKESGPWGSKIQHLAAIAQCLGAQVVSRNYGDLPAPGICSSHPVPRHSANGALSAAMIPCGSLRFSTSFQGENTMKKMLPAFALVLLAGSCYADRTYKCSRKG